MPINENSDTLTGYELSRNWFNWCFENPDLITPTHTAMYFFIIEHWNRLGQKGKFGLPMEMTKDALGIKNYKTFSKVFNDLINWGFIEVHQKSKNQYSANIIALVKNTKALTKALTKASLKHIQKQVRGIVGVDKPNNQEPLNDLNIKEDFSEKFEKFRIKYPGTKRGFEIEFENFTKNNNLDIVDLLTPALEKEIEHRRRTSELKGFVPDWKNLYSWINNKCWQQEFPEINKQEPKKQTSYSVPY